LGIKVSQAFSEFDIEQLNYGEKLELIARLWDSLSSSSEAIPLPNWHIEVLEQRLAAADDAPDQVIPWEQVRDRLRQTP
jgi:putative addiction module component (TIGR02574 family)